MSIVIFTISGHTHEFIIYAMRQRQFAIIKKSDFSFLCLCPVIDNEFRHNIVERSLLIHSASTATLTML